MTGPDPFVPPAEAIRPPSAPTPPPPSATQRGAFFPADSAPPLHRRHPRWLLPVVVVVSTVVLAALAVGIGALLLSNVPRIINAVAGPPSLGEDDWVDYPPVEDLLEGDPGSPIAASPLDCAACFTPADAKALQLDDTLFEQLGLTEGVGAPQSLRLARVQGEAVDQWRDDQVAPDACYPIWPYAPVPMTPEELDRDDPSFIETVVTKPDQSDPEGYYAARSSMRVFTDSAGAVIHMTGLVDAIDACPEMSSAGGYAFAISAAPALDLPADVGGYTWAADLDGRWRYYGADLQRGNLVVRLTFNSDGYGPTEGDFRAFVEEYARQLSAATPSG
jgi:hypothetical protein